MKCLLDTQILIWVLGRLDLLPPAMRDLIEDPASAIYFSVINIWEVVIKANLPRRDLHVDPQDARREALSYGFRELQVTAEHAFAVRALPAIHKDPFDRMLIAQAIAENVPIISNDKALDGYGAQRLW